MNYTFFAIGFIASSFLVEAYTDTTVKKTEIRVHPSAQKLTKEQLASAFIQLGVDSTKAHDAALRIVSERDSKPAPKVAPPTLTREQVRLLMIEKGLPVGPPA